MLDIFVVVGWRMNDISKITCPLARHLVIVFCSLCSSASPVHFGLWQINIMWVSSHLVFSGNNWNCYGNWTILGVSMKYSHGSVLSLPMSLTISKYLCHKTICLRTLTDLQVLHQTSIFKQVWYMDFNQYSIYFRTHRTPLWDGNGIWKVRW